MTTAHAITFDAGNPAFGPALAMTEHWDKLLEVAWSEDKFFASMFFNFIPEMPFPHGRGTSQQYGVWRAGQIAVLGLADWSAIVETRNPGTDGAGDPGVSACKSYEAKELSFGGNELFRNSGKTLLLKSPALCVADLQYLDEAPLQMSVRVNHLIRQNMEYRTSWGREEFIRAVMFSDHGYIMTPKGSNPNVGAGASYPKFYYNPDLNDATSGTPCLYYPEGTKISTLNWDILEDQLEYLESQAGDAATGNMNGRPTFLAYGNSQDLRNAIIDDAEVREDFRYAKAQILIGDFREFTSFRNVSIGHDPGQMRFKPDGIVDGTSIANGRGGLLGPGNWVKCTRVSPETTGRTILDGAKVTMANPDYFSAALRLLPILMNKVFIKQVGVPFTNIGSGMTFGPTPGMNGEMLWINVQHKTENPFREIGSWFSRFRYWVKPDRHYQDAVCYLYASCKREDVKLCGSATTTTSAVNLGAAAAVADVDATNYTITVTLAAAIQGATGGTAVTVTDTSGGTPDGYILDASQAPIYVIGFDDIAWATFSDSTSATTIAADLTVAATVDPTN